MRFYVSYSATHNIRGLIPLRGMCFNHALMVAPYLKVETDIYSNEQEFDCYCPLCLDKDILIQIKRLPRIDD